MSPDEPEEEQTPDPEEISPEELAREVTGGEESGEEIPEEEDDETEAEEDSVPESEEDSEAEESVSEEQLLSEKGEEASSGSSAEEEPPKTDEQEEVGEEGSAPAPEGPGKEETEATDTGTEIADDKKTDEPEAEVTEGDEEDRESGEEEGVEDEAKARESEGGVDEEQQEKSEEGRAGEEQREEPVEEVDEEAEQPGEEAGGESIKDVLEREAERAQQEEEEEEEKEEKEEKLPGEYLSADQLPEREEFTVPAWIKNTGWISLAIILAILIFWYILLPGIEALLTARMRASMKQDNLQSAGIYYRIGSSMGGILVKYPDKFQADYFTSLLDQSQLTLFKREYEANIGHSPGPYTRQIYAEYLCKKGQWEELLAAAKELQQNYETRGVGYLFAGRSYLHLGKFEQARDALENGVSFRRNDASFDRLRRDIALQEGNFEVAGKSAEDLFSKLKPGKEKNKWNTQDYRRASDYVARGNIWAHTGQMNSAVQMYESALVLEPYHRQALQTLIFHFAINKRWTSIENYLKGGGRWKKYRELYPLDSLGWWALSELELELNNEVDKSIQFLRRARSLNPVKGEIYRIAGKIYLEELGAPVLAVGQLEQARERGLQRLTYRRLLARAYFRAELFQQAANEYKYLRRQPEFSDKSELLYNIASCYLGARKLDKADSYLLSAQQAGYREASLYNQRGLVRELQGDSEAAITNFFQGKELAGGEPGKIKLLADNLKRFLQGAAPIPLAKWMAPVERDY